MFPTLELIDDNCGGVSLLKGLCFLPLKMSFIFCNFDFRGLLKKFSSLILSLVSCEQNDCVEIFLSSPTFFAFSTNCFKISFSFSLKSSILKSLLTSELSPDSLTFVLSSDLPSTKTAALRLGLSKREKVFVSTNQFSFQRIKLDSKFLPMGFHTSRHQLG